MQVYGSASMTEPYPHPAFVRFDGHEHANVGLTAQQLVANAAKIIDLKRPVPTNVFGSSEDSPEFRFKMEHHFGHLGLRAAANAALEASRHAAGRILI